MWVDVWNDDARETADFEYVEQLIYWTAEMNLMQGYSSRSRYAQTRTIQSGTTTDPDTTSLQISLLRSLYSSLL